MESHNGALNLQQFSCDDDEDKSFMHALELAFSATMNMTLRAAVELGILEIIVNAGPGAKLSAEEIVAQLPTLTINPEAPDMIERMLRLLSLYNIVNCAVEAVEDSPLKCKFGGAPVCKFFTSDSGVSLAPLVLLGTDMVNIQSWSHLKYSVTNGGYAFNIAFNMSFFEYARSEPRFNTALYDGLTSISVYVIKKLIDTYDGFNDIKTLIDVGGGLGITMSMIISKYSHIEGINFDLPHIISSAKTYRGVEHIGGDMFVSVPNGDAIFMKHVVHNWDDENCVKILKNCWKSLPHQGKVIIVECILPQIPVNTHAAKFLTCLDVAVLANFGAKQRTKEEFEELSKKAGFSVFKATNFIEYYCIIEFTK